MIFIKEVRQVLAELELLSHGKTVSYNPSTSGGHSGSKPPTGESEPPHLVFKARFEACQSVSEALRVLDEAQAELDSLRKRTTPVQGLDGEELLRRQILEDHVGNSAAEVAIRLYCTTSKVRKIRGDAMCDPESGIELLPVAGLPTGRANQAAHLHEMGYSQQEIADRLGVSQATVSRLLVARRIRRNAA